MGNSEEEVLQEFNIELPYVLATPFLGRKSVSQRDGCTSAFISALSTLAKRQPCHKLAVEWIKKT